MRPSGETTGREMLDVVDHNNIVVAQMSRQQVHQQGLRHRSVHVLMTNSGGDIFVQLRAKTKDCAPGLWDTSAAGHVDAGESYAAAAPRELGEELGIAGLTLEPLFMIPASADTGNEFVQVYRCQTDREPVLDKREIDAGQWLSAHRLGAWIARQPEQFTAVFKEVYRRCYATNVSAA